MAKNRLPSRPHKQPTPAMSPSHPHTVNAVTNLPVVDDDEDDICPVCESECTCDNKRRTTTTTPILSPETATSASTWPSSTSLSPQPQPPITSLTPGLHSLKIKLTVPPSLLAKNRASAAKKSKNSAAETTSAGASGAETGASPSGSPFSPPGQPLLSAVPLDANGPKRRGRPPKAVVAARESVKALAASDSVPSAADNAESSRPSGSSRSSTAQPIRTNRKNLSTVPKTKLPPTKSKGKGTTVKKSTSSVVKTKKNAAVVVVSSSSELTEEDQDGDDDDAESVQFPTFVSAMSTSSNEDSSDSSSLSDFESDSSIEAEEEGHIIAEEGEQAREKARVRRELLGEDGVRKKWGRHNNWEIRPRKNSVGPDDAKMELDSDDEASDEEEEEEEDMEEDEDDADETTPSVSYAGVATGWSDDEESSFDADLFFANLSDSSANDSSAGESEDEGQPSALSPPEPADIHRRQIVGLPFEVTAGWDGQLVFTNGLKDGEGVLDIDFEASAAQLAIEAANAPGYDTDEEMNTSDGDGDTIEDSEEDEDMYLSDGDTTEEEFVDDYGLPTPRAMMLFQWPTPISSINPLAIVSPAGSPVRGSGRAVPSSSRKRRRSPRPADILEGRVFWSDSDDCDVPTSVWGDSSDVMSPRSSSRSTASAPAMGQFDLSGVQARRRAIITGVAAADIPSPFAKLRRRRNRRPGSRSGSPGNATDAYRKRLLFSTQSQSGSSFQTSGDRRSLVTPDLPPAEPIDLDDVLDMSFLMSEPLDFPSADDTLTRSEQRGLTKDLSRWDRVPVGTFRSIRATLGVTSEDSTSKSWPVGSAGGTSIDPYSYGSSTGELMKRSPFGASSVWKGKSAARRSKPGHRRSKSGNMAVVISPVILPVRDGDKTPTNGSGQHQQMHSPHYQSPHKSHKVLRREKKMLRKQITPTLSPRQHHHNHHPNSKTRSSSSMQRTHHFGSSVPPLSI